MCVCSGIILTEIEVSEENSLRHRVYMRLSVYDVLLSA